MSWVFLEAVPRHRRRFRFQCLKSLMSQNARGLQGIVRDSKKKKFYYKAHVNVLTILLVSPILEKVRQTVSSCSYY